MAQTSIKTELHSNNKHRNPYDFDALILANPLISDHVIVNKYGTQTINFFDNEAVKKIGDEKNNQIQSDSQKSKELSEKISRCVSAINQMPCNELLTVVEQHSVGGIQSATNYILNGKQILRTKRSQY